MKNLLDDIRYHTQQESYLFKGDSCAIVGNSSKLLNSKLGNEIDSHDFVMRFNHATVKGFEKDVGSKTSLRFINIHSVAAINGYDMTENLKIFPKLSKDIFKDLEEINFLAKPNVDLQNVKKIYPHMSFSNLSNTTINFIDSMTKLDATSGFIGIILGLSHFHKVSCFGFDFYNGDTDHYFEDVVKYDRNQAHDMKEEKKIVSYLHRNKLINFK